MNKIFLFFCLSFTVVSFCTNTLLAADIYVDNGGCGDCTTYRVNERDCGSGSETVYDTVAEAVAAMNGGDDIYIRGGTYNENCISISGNDSGSINDYSSIQSYLGEWAIIDGQRNCNCTAKAVFAMYSSPQLQYFKFERLEIKGGGLAGGGSVIAAGINLWSPKNITIRFCYIHDNLSDSSSENPAGISLYTPIDCTIEFCYLNNNGTDGSLSGNACNINFFSDYRDTTPGDFNVDDCTRENIVRYNLIDSTEGYTGTGLRHKNQQIFGEEDRNPTDMTYKNYGDKFHNNIIRGMSTLGIEAQQDFCQVYKNVIHHYSGTKDGTANGGIFIKKYSSNAMVYNTIVYNNTIIGSNTEMCGIHISGLGSSKDFHPYAQVYNNIVTKFADDYRREDVSLGTTINSANDWSPIGTITLSDCPIDRNYIYCPADADEFAVARSGYFGGDNRFTTAEFNTSYSVLNFANSYNASDLLFSGTTGSAQYKTRSVHILTGVTTVGNGGIGGNHPYLTGVTIPSYIGAVNPDGPDSGVNWDPNNPDPNDAGWVDYVLNVVGKPSAVKNINLTVN